MEFIALGSQVVCNRPQSLLGGPVIPLGQLPSATTVAGQRIARSGSRSGSVTLSVEQPSSRTLKNGGLPSRRGRRQTRSSLPWKKPVRSGWKASCDIWLPRYHCRDHLFVTSPSSGSQLMIISPTGTYIANLCFPSSPAVS